MRTLTTARLLTISLLLITCFTPGCAQRKDTQELAQAPARVAAVEHPAGPPEPIGAQQNGILLVYPKDGSTIASASTFLIGAVAPGSTLTANGSTVRVNAQGYFAHVIALKYGGNPIKIVSDGLEQNSFTLTVQRPAPPGTLPASPLRLLGFSAEPREDLGITSGDLIQFAIRGAPGAQASVQLGGRLIPLYGAGKKPSVNLGLDTTYGVTYQRSPAMRDLYSGFYRVQATDTFQNAQPIFFLKQGAKTLRATAKGKITVVKQPFVARTVHDKTVVRVAPGLARTTPFVEGVRVLVDGYKGDAYRCEMFPGKHLWILKEDLVADESPSIPPTAPVRTVNLEEESGAARVIIPLDQRLPYQVEQHVNPNKLVLKLFGGVADTDWVTAPVNSEANGNTNNPNSTNSSGKTFPSDRTHSPISYVTWGQLSDRLYQTTVHLNLKQQWGFFVDYEGTNLILHIKTAPDIAGGKSLQGLTICVDPGHGGRETGAIGCGGIKEATINLAIASKLQRLLEDRGATVIMTRKEDIDVSLADRVATAVSSKADLLVSIHNNALPDGRNPWTEKGTSTYWYHPQSLLLAKQLKDSSIASTQFNDYGTRFQNLALCRPSEMPAVLVEVGFMINPDEYAQLIDPSVQEKAARGLVQGIAQFLTESTSETTTAQKNAGKKINTNNDD